MDSKKAHFIGIGGIGMSAVAKLLKDKGVRVTGSDEEVYPPVSDFLQQYGLPYKTPYAAANIPNDIDLIVIGKNAKLVAETNPEVAAAFKNGVRILSFPEVLGEISQEKENIVVAGSYGKSTVTALLAHCLITAGKDPSYFIGASPYKPDTSAKIGRGNLFVLEGDEYPSSNTDPRSKFLYLHPSHLLITPLAHDHFNVFPAPEDYLKPFEQLVKLVPPSGVIVMAGEGPLSGRLRSYIPQAVIYGLHRGVFTSNVITWGVPTEFEILQDKKPIVRVQTYLLGEHNIENIVGAAALLFSLNLVTPEQFADAVKTFKGIRRRLDKKSDKTSVPVYEGFGSSYDKAKSAVAAIQRHFPTRRLLVVFEPNTIGWRSRRALSQYDDVFKGAAKVYVFNPPHEGKTSELSLADVVERIRSSGIDAFGVNTAEEALALLALEMAKNDCILISSSGGMGGLPESIPALAEKKFPK